MTAKLNGVKVTLEIESIEIEEQEISLASKESIFSSLSSLNMQIEELKELITNKLS